MTRNVGRESLRILGPRTFGPRPDSDVTKVLGYLLLLLAVVVCYQFSIPQAWGQTEQAAITGNVTDVTGAAVPDATVTATNVRTQVAAVTKTNPIGYYIIPYLPIGEYTVRAEKAGFNPNSQIELYFLASH